MTNILNLKMFLSLALVIFTSATAIDGQRRNEPIITKTVKHETKENTAIKEAIYGWKGTNNVDEIRYHYNKVDLNGDGQLDAVVSILNQMSCGTGGCPMLIFRGNGGNYQLLTEMSVSRPPLIVLSTKTNGWNDLVMFVSGGGIEPYYSLLKFDGKIYPENPTVEPQIPKRRKVKGIEYLSGIETYETGFLLK